jgi:hypothetical protein
MSMPLHTATAANATNIQSRSIGAAPGQKAPTQPQLSVIANDRGLRSKNPMNPKRFFSIPGLLDSGPLYAGRDVARISQVHSAAQTVCNLTP